MRPPGTHTPKGAYLLGGPSGYLSLEGACSVTWMAWPTAPDTTVISPFATLLMICRMANAPLLSTPPPQYPPARRHIEGCHPVSTVRFHLPSSMSYPGLSPRITHAFGAVYSIASEVTDKSPTCSHSQVTPSDQILWPVLPSSWRLPTGTFRRDRSLTMSAPVRTMEILRR